MNPNLTPLVIPEMQRKRKPTPHKNPRTEMFKYVEVDEIIEIHHSRLMRMRSSDFIKTVNKILGGEMFMVRT